MNVKVRDWLAMSFGRRWLLLIQKWSEQQQKRKDRR